MNQHKEIVEPPDVDTVHIWYADVSRMGERLAGLHAVLSPDEAARAARYRFAADRDLFVVARGMLRTVLGETLHIAPSEVRFTTGEFGKPHLNPAHHQQDIRFNVSHTRGCAVCAIRYGREVGIDVENVSVLPILSELLPRILTAYEQEQVAKATTSERGNLLMTLWTTKEAYLKARGVGLHEDLHSFAIEMPPSAPYPTLAWVRDVERRCEIWQLFRLAILPTYHCALALPFESFSSPVQILLHDFSASSGDAVH